MPSVKLTVTSLMLGGLLLAGCTTSTTMLDDNWGRSVETATFNQTLDPQAGESTEPVEGMSGQNALTILTGSRGQ